MQLKHLPVTMIRRNLNSLPHFPLPPGFSHRLFRKGDESLWAGIETAVSEFKNEKAALAHFDKEFRPFMDDMENRCLLLERNGGGVIGTATAWYNSSFREEDHGRLHWLAVHPDFQGKGLAKPLVSLVMKMIKQYHRRAYLTSQTTSHVAIRVYLDFGFEPLIEGKECLEAWRLLEEKLMRPIISRSI